MSVSRPSVSRFLALLGHHTSVCALDLREALVGEIPHVEWGTINVIGFTFFLPVASEHKST